MVAENLGEQMKSIIETGIHTQIYEKRLSRKNGGDSSKRYLTETNVKSLITLCQGENTGVHQQDVSIFQPCLVINDEAKVDAKNYPIPIWAANFYVVYGAPLEESNCIPIRTSGWIKQIRASNNGYRVATLQEIEGLDASNQLIRIFQPDQLGKEQALKACRRLNNRR